MYCNKYINKECCTAVILYFQTTTGAGLKKKILTMWYQMREIFELVPLYNYACIVVISFEKLCSNNWIIVRSIRRYISYDFLIMYTGLYSQMSYIDTALPIRQSWHVISFLDSFFPILYRPL